MSRLAISVSLLVVMLAACGEEPSGTTTTVSGALSSSSEMSLTPTGIGDVDFGTPPEDTIASFTSLIGGRGEDYDWTAEPIFGTCPGLLTRGVTWGSFVALFSEDEAGVQQFFAWTYGYDPETGTSGADIRELGLQTLDGIGLGATRAELRDVYGDRLVETEDLSIEVWGFTIDSDQTQYLSGLLSGPGDEAVVMVIESTPGCETRGS
jgi:hypothetical protein